MAKAVFFNKGLVKGKVVKADIVKFEGKGDKKGGEFLSLEVDTGSGNKIKSTLFPSKANPNKHTEMLASYPVGSMVEVSGSVNEKEYESNGKKGIDRSVSAFGIRPLKEDSKPMATFIIQGIVKSVKETNSGAIVKVDFIDSYEKDGKVIKKDPVTFTLEGDVAEQIDDLSVVKGCNAKFKGKIFNKLEFDDYGDITGNIQMFQIEKIENVIDPDDLEEDDEELPF